MTLGSMLLKNKSGLLSLALFLLLIAVPLILAFGYAALYSVGLAGILHRGWTLEHWAQTLSSPEVGSSFLFSFYVAATTLFITLTISLLLALDFQKHAQGRWFSTVFYFPLAIPAVVASFFTFQVLSKAGVLSRVFFHLGVIGGLEQFPDLINDRFGIGIIATHVMMSLPFFTIVFTNLYESEKIEELHQLSQTLGATSIQASWRVGIPILFRRAFPTIILYFIFVFGSYEIPLLLGRQSPQMISVLMIRKLQRFNLMDIPTAYSIAMMYLILAGGMILLLFGKRKPAYDL